MYADDICNERGTIEMLKHLKLKNVGPTKQIDLIFGDRINMLTGDNGLGKSFILDIAWWALTRRWPGDINPKLSGGRKAIPASSDDDATIGFSFTGKLKKETYESSFLRREQAWTGRPGRPSNPGLVFYAMSDGSFAIWDPARNYWRTQEGVDVQERIPAYVFSPSEVWDGLIGGEGKPLCVGLVADWAGWQKEKRSPFKSLCSVLEVLSPSEKEIMRPGDLTRISLDDARDIPTIRMPYGQDIAVLHASAGMRRILSIAYLLVWAWEEHQKAARLLGEPSTNQVTLLIDEVESHLHPQWQRKIIPALFSGVETLIKKANIQFITATHSPLIMASIEPLFKRELDAWFDFDISRKKVSVRNREFEKHGDADGWLTSEAFDLSSTRSIPYENLIKKASMLADRPHADALLVKKMNDELVEALGPTDDFLFRWRYVCKEKGWLK
jgi:predicted ATPase